MRNIKCYLCGGKVQATIQNGVRHGSMFKVKKCFNCGLVFLYPVPDDNQLNDYYRNKYRKDYCDPPAEERFYSDIPEAKLRLKRIKNELTKKTKLLEIGCGTGAFLKTISPYVNNVFGIEPDDESRQWIKEKLNFDVVSDIENLDKGEKFDMVVMFHVLEHLPDPVNFLKKLKEIMKKRAKLIIEVPNVNDALIALYQVKEFCKFYYQRAHLYYFSSHTLKKVLKKAGFNNFKVNGIQRYDFSNHIRWMLTGKPGGNGYYNSVFGKKFNDEYARILIEKGYADTLWATVIA
ncbi:MAG: class I SAM-dependent methyltransferase [Candidatus Omnitrophica bacterium]|nr:class I SAM-dependent methyltransferase [Candidatus Omnitrophota bacterium]